MWDIWKVEYQYLRRGLIFCGLDLKFCMQLNITCPVSNIWSPSLKFFKNMALHTDTSGQKGHLHVPFNITIVVGTFGLELRHPKDDPKIPGSTL